VADAGVSVGAGAGLGLACVESMRGTTHATAKRARSAIAAPSPIQKLR
jgi:hypothetical protein